ncbi:MULTISPECIES: restriction endonuclease subunit S [Citrobacter]|jgi:type I restriction enzyme S subunit|uniref:Restriction endonuclease subunit S n=1 Tax=Citrobacter portucalensis TaxID=1639133 RepID=A0ABD5GWY8_9ENTR|nr:MULTISPECIES: restriction endonuclease subunit S [Citrobacter]EGS5521376.1 restriction endonuclease subunit S [Citrobacter freundii]MBJ8709312.1 restriction endonuclease subunit S [Citrobacter freundii]MCY3418775.1 restriction endonuclease subunit S [Citrobacter freundii]MDW2633620.1 restriction endonuclease subunit S [Citrobacter portucalensis]HCC4722143.1 restriction endonuclease subunit S [Citrobacter freundii]
MSELNFFGKLLDGIEIEWLPIGDIAEIYGGLTGKTKADFEKGNAKYISYKTIFGSLDINNIPTDCVDIREGERQHNVRYGDVLFTGSSEIAEEAGMSSAVTSQFDVPVYLNSFSFGVRFNDEIKIKPEFSKYLFRTSMMRTEIARTASGVTRFNISKARFKKVLIPVPCPGNPEKSLAIQSEIVRILDKFTALTAELTAELSMRKKQYNYYRDQSLSFDDGEVEWKTLGEITRKIASGRNKTRQAEGDFPVYGSTGLLGFTNEPAYFGDLLLVARVGAYAGLVNAVFGHFDVSDNTLIIHPSDSWNARFAFHQLTHMNLNQYAVGAGQPLITGGLLKNLKVPVPPLNEQIRIAKILDKFETMTVSITEGLPREIELRQKQYEYYRDMLFSFPKPDVAEA